jgi:hypothetical protein
MDWVNSWDVSNVTKMSCMFRDAPYFNQDVRFCDVSSVTDMSFMFCGAIFAFNQDIGPWDVSKVTDMEKILFRASSY